MKITTQFDYEVILANHSRPVFFAISFEAPTGESRRPKPISFCLVLDQSGSMAGPPLEKVKQAAQLAVRNLRPEDSFALVTFSQEARVWVPLQPAVKKADFIRAIENLRAGGGTNLTAGWMLGRDEIRKAPAEGSRRVLLLSDGLLNVGITQPEAVRQLAATGLQQDGVRTSCLGFGPKYNEDLMTAMAQVSGGQFYDADSPEKFTAIFDSELDGLQKLTIQNLRVRLRRLDFCETLFPLGNYPAVARPDGWTEYFVGDLVSGESRVACFQLGVMALPWVDGRPVASLEGERLLEVEIAYDEIGRQEITSRTESRVMRIQATQNPDEVRAKAEVIPWVALQRAGQVIDQVTVLLDAHKMIEALAVLNEAIAGLKNYGPQATVAEAVRQLENMLRRVSAGEWSERARKTSRYTSHSYRRMSSRELWTLESPPPSFKPPTPPLPPTDPNPPPA